MAGWRGAPAGVQLWRRALRDRGRWLAATAQQRGQRRLHSTDARSDAVGQGMTAVPSPPTATYRLQFHAGFTFRDATRLVPYLHDLGISHVYASPYLKARSGSTHGYDVADPSSLNPELGSEEDYESFVAELKRFGM